MGLSFPEVCTVAKVTVFARRWQGNIVVIPFKTSSY
jgi:hypothetical protein